MISVQLYVKGERVTLFKDEVISLTSSIQNINDISKTYTDFTQTFTIPADKNNNKIFNHWYNSFIDNTFDSKVRVDAFINIDTKKYRSGVLQLEDCQTENGLI